jgi:hypothetical protein
LEPLDEDGYRETKEGQIVKPLSAAKTRSKYRRRDRILRQKKLVLKVSKIGFNGGRHGAV